MTSLLVAKQYLRKFYGKYEAYLLPLLKFLLAFLCLLLINGRLGFTEKLKNPAVVLVMALMCSFMPQNFIIIVAAGFILLHLYSISLECAAVALAFFLIMFLLYFRFSPKDSLAVLLTPVCFWLKVPYVVPISMGLLGTPSSAVSTACGVTTFFLIDYVSENATTLGGMEAEETTARFRYLIDGILNNRAMLVTIAAFAVTILLVYFIRRLSIDHSWTIAIVSGALVNVMILLVGDLMFDTNVSIAGVIVGTAVSALLVKVLQFFVFNVDYSRTEKVQFEDDEYYYYVKAVPKVTVAAPERTVKKINSQKRARPSQSATQSARPSEGRSPVRK